jgi:AraC family transcriptional regulator
VRLGKAHFPKRPPSARITSTQRMLVLHRNRHSAGEYCFTPDSLSLSVSLNRCKVEMAYDGRLWSGTSVRGDVKVLPEGEPRIFRHRDSCEFAFITIDERKLSVWSGSTSGFRPHARLQDPPLRLVIEALLSESNLGPPATLFREGAALAIVSRLRALDGAVAAKRERRLPRQTLGQILEFLEAHLDEDVSIESLARLAGLSAAHFSTLFRASTGEPPHRYHTRLRVDRARALIERGASVADAALAVGFYDQSHLSRHMRRLYGTQPKSGRGGR